MFSQSRMYHTTIEMYLGSVGNYLKSVKRFVEFIIVVVSQRFDPRFDFLEP
jgi:hypothetical protein